MEKEKNDFSKKVMNFYLTRASEIMKTDIPSVRLDEPIKNVMNEIGKKSIDHLWVLDNNGRLAGIVTEKDLLDGIKVPLFGERIAWDALEMKSLLYRNVKTAEDMMTSRLFKCKPDTELKTIVNIMVDNKIRHFPVMEGDMIVGEININQIITFTCKNFFD